MLLAGVLSTVTAIAVAASLDTASAAPGSTEEAAPPSAVETFEYPNAEKILKEKGIALRKGDGHILLADCSASQDIQVMTRQNKEGQYCFKVTGNGKSGYLTLEIPESFYITTEDFAVRAKLTADGKSETVDVPKNGFKGVGEAAYPPGKSTTLVELRVTG
ncbi:hypothetical protein ACQEVX_24080 [Streptomyces syringium]|uniref:hypothetical protein n=1 Tax=Streptomyces syringium TaxID=76729 RepID=UPI003D90CF13